MEVLDFFSYQKNGDGTFTVLKNGEYFINCTGTETDVQNLVKALQEDNEK